VTALLALLLALAGPALAQRGGCGLGLGLQAMAGADQLLAAEVTGLAAGREQAGAAVASLAEAAARLQGCGCRRVADQVAEAGGIAESARAAAEVPALRRTLERARHALGLARERAGRDGCA
jgi:hypothetical protein